MMQRCFLSTGAPGAGRPEEGRNSLARSGAGSGAGKGRQRMGRVLCGIVVSLLLVASLVAGESTPPRISRYVAIDNVCAWPNLTLLRDGSIAAIIHNRPSHGVMDGAIDCWASRNGEFWEKRGQPAPNEPGTVRMNVAAGLTGNGDLLVLCSGWGPERFRPHAVLRLWICRSADGGRTWTRCRNFLAPEKGWSEFVPFGRILAGEDGTLHASCYARGLADPKARHAWHFLSSDDGRSWRLSSLIGADHNETCLLHLGGKNWLAAARTNPEMVVELFRSADHGASWHGGERATERGQVNGHLLRLKDGRVLLSYGNRVPGEFGVMAKLSRDEGRTWSGPIRLAKSRDTDCGYPSSVQRADGMIVTGYYAKSAENHERYHMAVAIWEPPATGD